MTEGKFLKVLKSKLPKFTRGDNENVDLHEEGYTKSADAGIG